MTYPSEKWWSESQLGWLFPAEWTNKKWSKPPSSRFLHQRSRLSVVWQFDLPLILRIVGNRNANVLFSWLELVSQKDTTPEIPAWPNKWLQYSTALWDVSGTLARLPQLLELLMLPGWNSAVPKEFQELESNSLLRQSDVHDSPLNYVETPISTCLNHVQSEWWLVEPPVIYGTP